MLKKLLSILQRKNSNSKTGQVYQRLHIMNPMNNAKRGGTTP